MLGCDQREVDLAIALIGLGGADLRLVGFPQRGIFNKSSAFPYPLPRRCEVPGP